MNRPPGWRLSDPGTCRIPEQDGDTAEAMRLLHREGMLKRTNFMAMAMDSADWYGYTIMQRYQPRTIPGVSCPHPPPVHDATKHLLLIPAVGCARRV